ncbi:MAG: alpha/beta-hydrolase family protein [Candidatus Nanopelagicales bacterium]
MNARPDRRYLALRTGVAAAAGIASGTFARGLLPRSTSDQAIATAVTAAYGIGAGTVAVSAIEASAELVADARGHGSPETTTLITAALLSVAGIAASKVLPDTHDTPLPVAAVSSAARVLGGGSLAATLVVASDELMQPLVGRRGAYLGIASAAAIGGATSAMRVRRRELRAERLGETGDRAQIVPPASAKGLVKSIVLGAGVGGGLLTLAGVEYALAEGSARLISLALCRRDDPVTPLVGHAVAAAGLVPAGGWALNRLRRRLMHADDVIEPAYQEPPTSHYVTAGPTSLVSFDDIGKEGRRFVLMALTADAITEVVGEPAIDPIRAVAGFDSADTPQGRAELALAELEALGAYERSRIVVAAPTGVGYVNYSFAEALEYLSRGDCAIVVPQYAHLPSALALNRTKPGIQMQSLILRGVRDRISELPEGHRPRLLQFGESLGAQVALDIAAEGTHVFDELGLEGGLYFGTPFRTKLWDRWFNDPESVDPDGILGMVAQADEIPGLDPTVRHIQVIHHDDPINKFSYDSLVRQPWWMGPPETRPPGVPRESSFRPVVTFVISLVDLKNGMDTRPGVFVRQGHDYRIELAEALRHGFHLPASDEQVARIEKALRDREREWAARRMVARRFANARAAVLGQLSKWGVEAESIGLDEQSAAKLARGDVSGLMARFGTSGPSQ